MRTKLQNNPPDIRVKTSEPKGAQRAINSKRIVSALLDRGEVRIRLDAYVYDPVLRRYSPFQGQTMTALCRSAEAAELVVKKVGEVVRGMDGVRLNGGGR